MRHMPLQDGNNCDPEAGMRPWIKAPARGWTCRLVTIDSTMDTPADSHAAATHSSDPRARALCRTMASIHRRGWCDGTGGNFSVVLERSPELRLLMAPSGVDKGRVRPNQLIVINGAGKVISGEGRVSAEMPLHRTIVMRTGAGAVLHTHSQAATLLSRQAEMSCIATAKSADTGTGETGPSGMDQPQFSADQAPAAGAHLLIEGLEMLKGLEGHHTHACRIHIPVLANDQDLARLSAAAEPHLETAPHGILIAGHGLYAWGRDLEQASRHLEILEFLMEQSWRQRLWDAINGDRS